MFIPAGFSQAEQVSSYYSDAYYPLGQVQCCTPAVLLATGETWPVQRCNCTQVRLFADCIFSPRRVSLCCVRIGGSNRNVVQRCN